MIRWAPAALAGALAFAALSAGAAGAPASGDPAPAGVDAEAIVRRAEGALAGGPSEFEALLSVVSRRGRVEHSARFHAWLDPEHRRSLVRVSAPPKRAGIAFLVLPPNLWSYRPEGDESALVPPSARTGAWLESDFAYDDVLDPASDLSDYEPRLLRVDPAAGKERVRAWVIELRPRAPGDAGWQRIVEWVAVEPATLLRKEFYADRETSARTIRFEDVREVAGRRVPFRWVASTGGDRGGESRIELEKIGFDGAFAADLFALRGLRGGQREGSPAR